jgi:poly(hydroxyalkanoate) depolymerase family esterase
VSRIRPSSLVSFLTAAPLRARLAGLWPRLRNWLRVRSAQLRGRWHHGEVGLSVARWTWWPLPWQQERWRYATYCPAGLADDEPAPLVVVLHGCGQEAMFFAAAAGLTNLAQRHRLRLLAPEQHARANPLRCWNWFHPAAQNGRGELEVVLRAIDAVSAEVQCSKVLVLGLSAGAGLAALLAFHHPDRFAAVATMAAPPLLGRGSLQDPRRVMREGLGLTASIATHLVPGCTPLLVLHGTDDEVVAPRCAEQLAEQALHVLARRHGPLQSRTGDGAVDHFISPSGADDPATRLLLRLHLLPGLGHAWSGAPGGHAHVQREGPPIAQLMLEFFREVGALDRAR